MANTLTEREPSSLTVYPILLALSICHLLNDTMQSLITAIYPIIKDNYALTFSQVGLITLAFQFTASLLQPAIGLYTDKKPQPYSLAIGMSLTLIGLASLAYANHFYSILLAAGLIGTGSAIFHPESSRMANAASGGKRGLAQSIFQVGGNAGSSVGPLLAAWIVVPYGQKSLLWFTLFAFIAIAILARVGRWYQRYVLDGGAAKRKKWDSTPNHIPKSKVVIAILVLLMLIFSKYFYLASLTSYFTFFLIEKFGVSIPVSQIYLFIFLFAVAVGTLLGGPVGDRIGRKYVIWVSILGTAPFSILLPYVSLFWVSILVVFIGIILASAFSAILVYAQELIPGKIGLVAGLFFGFAFGMGGIGSALIGNLIDAEGIYYAFSLCSYLPLIGLLTVFLPNIRTARKP